MNGTGKEGCARIVLACFCCMCFINDSRYLPRDNSIEILRRTQPRGNTVSFVYMSSPDSASEQKNYPKLAVKALRNIYIEEVWYIDYESKYGFWKL